MRLILGLMVLLLAAGPALAGGGHLSAKERALIEKHLGQDALSKPIEGNPIANAEKFFPFVDGSWTYRFTSGDDKGKTEKHTFTKIVRDNEDVAGRYSVGPEDFWFVRRDDEGNIWVVTEQDASDGVVIHYSPPQPLYVDGLEPGEIRESKIKVKIYDLSHPDHLKYSGELDLTLTYIGAYEITVPAGTYEAALVEWHFDGEVGPASVKETQYRFLVEGIGPVAVVEKKAISAFLIYNNDSRFGKVLIKDE